MEKLTFVENVKKQFVDADKIELNFDSEFRTIDSFDSLTGMTIMVMLKDEYNVEMSEMEFRASKTVSDLYKFVKSKIEK